MFEIALRARTRDAIPRTLHKIAPRVHRSRFGRARELGFHDGVFEIAPRERARDPIMNGVPEMTPRVRARGAIANDVLEIASRARLLQHLPIK